MPRVHLVAPVALVVRLLSQGRLLHTQEAVVVNLAALAARVVAALAARALLVLLARQTRVVEVVLGLQAAVMEALV